MIICYKIGYLKDLKNAVRRGTCQCDSKYKPNKVSYNESKTIECYSTCCCNISHVYINVCDLH